MSGPSGVQKKQLCSASSLMNDSYLLIVYAGYEKLLAEDLARDFMMDKKPSASALGCLHVMVG